MKGVAVRWVILMAFGLAACGSAVPSEIDQANGPPNVILIIADDFGIDASPCYDVGSEKPVMPTLQSLCDEGLVFDTAWVNPMCTPTRSTLLTGHYAFRTNVRQVNDVLDDGLPTIFDLLANDVPTPYANAVVGKWHVSGEEPPDLNAPSAFGVSHFAGFLSGALDSYFHWTIVEDGEPTATDTYATTKLTDEAIDWVGKQPDDPWFLWLAYNAPHWPYHLPPADLAPHATRLSGGTVEIERDPRPYYLAMGEALDTELGRLLASLDPATRAKTTIFFVGDNGTETDVAQPPFTEDHAKSSIYEGGIRVPLVVSGWGVTRSGEREDALINGVDIPATIATLAGSSSSTFGDGTSFRDALSDPSYEGRSFIYVDGIRDIETTGALPGWTVREGDYKLIHRDSGDEELYDLAVDPWEETNLIGSEDIAESVIESLRAIHDELVAAEPNA